MEREQKAFSLPAYPKIHLTRWFACRHQLTVHVSQQRWEISDLIAENLT
jgi:hypothetical protein